MNRQQYQKAFLFSTAFSGINVIWALFNNFMPITLGQLGLNAALIGFIMTWDNYLNMFIQPLIGNWSDHTETAIGRRKPWLMVGAPLAAICFVGISLNTSIVGIMIFILLTNFGMALFRSPAIALLGDLFPSEQRSIAGAVLDLMGGVGAISALIAGYLFFDSLGLTTTFMIGSFALLLSVSVVLLFIKEPQHRRIIESRTGISTLLSNLQKMMKHGGRSLIFMMLALLCGFLSAEALLAWLSSFGVYSLGLQAGDTAGIAVTFALSFLVFTIPAGWLATIVGRKRVILVGFCLTALVIAYGWWVDSPIGLVGIMITGGASWSLVSVNALPAMYDFVDEAYLGTMTGVYAAVTNIAAAVGPQSIGLLIELTEKNYRIMFVFSALFLVLATLLMLQVDDNFRVRIPTADDGQLV